MPAVIPECAVLPATVAEAAARFGDRPALVAAAGWPFTFADLHKRSDEVAAGLARMGVRAGHVVTLALPSTPDYVVAYVALAKLGATTAGINPSLAPPERARLVEIAESTRTIATADLADGLSGALLVVEVADDASGVLRNLAVEGGEPPPVGPEPERPVALIFTSGTTGVPKGAVFCDRQLAALVRLELGDVWDGGAPGIASTQFAHVGFMTKLPWTLRLGGTTHLLPRWRAADVLDLVERERMPAIGAIAPQLALMLADPRFDERDLSCVRTLTAGGAASSPALVEEARRRFDAIYLVRYSSTEGGGIATGTAPDADDDEVLHTVGRPRKGVELEIRDGEVCIRSDAVMSGYWRDSAATAEVLDADGWLRTGDLGELDDRGRLVLRGRSKEMYIRGGYNVFPVEVEAVLSSHPAVAEVVVIPRAEPVMGEIGVAVIVPRLGAEPPTLEDLRAFGRDRLATWKLPEALRVVDAIPRTAVHKIDRRALLAEEQSSEA